MEEIKMQCPECKSPHIRKNGINKQGKQNHICVTCSRQFIDNYEKPKGYDEKTKQECLIQFYKKTMGLLKVFLFTQMLLTERLTGF
jgi:transposase-like protein